MGEAGATIPVWAKMTPNVGNPTPAAAARGERHGIYMINTILSVWIDLRPAMPSRATACRR